MSDLADRVSGTRGRRGLDPRWIAAAVAAVIVSALFRHMTEDPAANLKAQFAADPYFQTLQETFPEERAAIEAQMTADVRNGMSSREAVRRAQLSTRAMVVKLAPLAAAAPASELRAIYQGELNVLRRLQKEDVRLCGEFGMRGLPADTELSPQTQRVTAEAGRMRLKAARAGRDTPVRWRAVGPQDGAALAAAMQRKGVVGDWSSEAAPPQAQCTAAIALYETLTELPDETGGPLMSAIVLASAKALDGAERAGA